MTPNPRQTRLGSRLGWRRPFGIRRKTRERVLTPRFPSFRSTIVRIRMGISLRILPWWCHNASSAICRRFGIGSAVGTKMHPHHTLSRLNAGIETFFSDIGT